MGVFFAFSVFGWRVRGCGGFFLLYSVAVGVAFVALDFVVFCAMSVGEARMVRWHGRRMADD